MPAIFISHTFFVYENKLIKNSRCILDGFGFFSGGEIIFNFLGNGRRDCTRFVSRTVIGLLVGCKVITNKFVRF